MPSKLSQPPLFGGWTWKNITGRPTESKDPAVYSQSACVAQQDIKHACVHACAPPTRSICDLRSVVATTGGLPSRHLRCEHHRSPSATINARSRFATINARSCFGRAGANADSFCLFLTLAHREFAHISQTFPRRETNLAHGKAPVSRAKILADRRPAGGNQTSVSASKGAHPNVILHANHNPRNQPTHSVLFDVVLSTRQVASPYLPS